MPRALLCVVVAFLDAGQAQSSDTCSVKDGSCDSPIAKLQDMRLYDDIKALYVSRAIERFNKTLTSSLSASALTDESFRLRARLLRSVDVMSYTVGVQQYIEANPPPAVRREDRLSGSESPVEEGSRLWCGATDTTHPMSHERRVLDKLLSGLKRDTGLLGLDIGSGYGGWPRLVAMERPEVDRIIGVEYQEHVRALADRLTDHSFEHAPSLRNRISFWRNMDSDGNDVRQFFGATQQPLGFAISFLCLLHIGHSRTDKLELFSGLANSMQNNGRIYFEDLLALPAALDKSKPAYSEKLRKVVWMNFLTTHQGYADILEEAGFKPTASTTSMVYDVTNAWKDFVHTRNSGFHQLKPDTLFCLMADGGIVPSLQGIKQGIDCETLSGILGSRELAEQYLSSQSEFFCGVCELFLGRGSLADGDCGCTGSQVELEDHPPLVGGAIIFAEKR